MFKEHFFHHTPLFLAKELYNSDQTINDEIVKHWWCIDWIKKEFNRKIIPENENQWNSQYYWKNPGI